MEEQKSIYFTELGEFILMAAALAGALAEEKYYTTAVWKAREAVKQLQKEIKRASEEKESCD